jgi:CheY-like chemotaxis protein
MSGLDVVEEIFSNLGRAIPTIVISADQSEKMMLEASRKGYSILAKPVKPAALRALMTRLLTPNNQQLN